MKESGHFKFCKNRSIRFYIDTCFDMIEELEDNARNPLRTEDQIHQIEEYIVEQVEWLLSAAESMPRIQFFMVFRERINHHIIWLRMSDPWTAYRWDWMKFQANRRQ